MPLVSNVYSVVYKFLFSYSCVCLKKQIGILLTLHLIFKLLLVGWSFSFIFYFFFILSYNSLQLQLPSFHSSRSPPPSYLLQIYSSVYLQKRTLLPGSIGITSYNKTSYEHSYHSWVRQPSRRKVVQRACERVRDDSTPTVRSPTKKKC